ncbi:hypothetical protein HY229_00420 [Candidatus Acetothermia bacterium]|nr:hypothetical protein [Candidatus Acetothermia bacterium]MBI3642556.1 hypothetical protein [Candidatus Acetothermia bacterium]
MGLGVIKTKTDLTNHLVALRLAAIYNIFALTCLHQFCKDARDGKRDLRSLSTHLPEGEIDFLSFIEQLVKDFGGPDQVEYTKRNATIAFQRNYLKEVFRITQSYCHRFNQKIRFSQQPWHDFAVVAVNSMSHDFRISFRHIDQNKLPISYKGFRLTKELEDKPAPMSLDILVALADDVINYAIRELV